jgi:hypothetical protein
MVLELCFSFMAFDKSLMMFFWCFMIFSFDDLQFCCDSRLFLLANLGTMWFGSSQDF